MADTAPAWTVSRQEPIAPLQRRLGTGIYHRHAATPNNAVVKQVAVVVGRNLVPAIRAGLAAGKARFLVLGWQVSAGNVLEGVCDVHGGS